MNCSPRFPLHFVQASLLLALASGGLSSCGNPRPPTRPTGYDLEIRPASGDSHEQYPETGLVTVRFRLSLEEALHVARQWVTAPGESGLEDPFAAGELEDPPVGTMAAFSKALEGFGVSFPEGTSLTYSDEAGELAVTHNPEVARLIQALLEGGSGRPSSVVARWEFYEVPALLALRLEQSAAAHHDHKPEWKALQGVLEQGEAKVIGVSTLQGLSGHRSTLEDGETVVHVSGYERDPDDPGAAPLPVVEERVAGIVLEMLPTIEGGSRVIDLHFSLEFHSAPPEWRAGEGGVSIPVFHAKRLITQLTLRSGDIKLLGSWTATGDSATERKGLRHLVFLTAHVP